MNDHYFKADNAAQLAKDNLKNILDHGFVQWREAGDWCMKKAEMVEMRETHNVCFELTDPRNCATSQHCLAAEIEAEDYLLGLNPGYVHLSPWSFYKRWLKQDSRYHYTYGDRGGKKLFEIILKLKAAPTSRQVVVNLWDIEKDFYEHFVPCTTQWVFYISYGRLFMTTTMRSQDACRGFFLDMFAYPLLQQFIAQSLDIPMGSYTHFIINSHIYRDDLDFAQRLLNELKPLKPLRFPALDFFQLNLMRTISSIIFTNHNTKLVESLLPQLPEFWQLWKKNQLIYVYTKFLSEQETPTELTYDGPVINIYKRGN